MKARVVGGTYDGGTRVLVERENGYECEVTERANGTLCLMVEAGDPPLVRDEIDAVERAAVDAINNYDPSDADIEAYYAGTPERGEVAEQMARIQRELK